MPVAPRESDYSLFDFDDWSNRIREGGTEVEGKWTLERYAHSISI